MKGVEGWHLAPVECPSSNPAENKVGPVINSTAATNDSDASLNR
jgi:hypothetical protein